MRRTPGRTPIFFFFLTLIFSASDSAAQVIINEICPANISGIRNSNGAFDDWIELYNAHPFNDAHLEDWGLSDDVADPYKFTFPDIELHAGERVLVFAGDFNKSRVVDHWEGLIGVDDWRYYSQSSAPDTNWRNPGFNNNWSTADAPFGFGSSSIATNTSSSNLAVAIRKEFTVNSPYHVLEAVLHVDYDDGFVAYLNGVEIARANLGVAGQRPAWNLPATTSHSSSLPGSAPDSIHLSKELLTALLVTGQNVLAIEVHNKLSSSDLVASAYLTIGVSYPAQSGTPPPPPSWFNAPVADHYSAAFKLARTGETIFLTDDNGVVVDQRSYDYTMSDNSRGCSPDGNASSWCTFSEPTPDSANGTSVCFVGYAPVPGFSLSPGFYSGSQLLELSASQPGQEIRYTTNGDEPGQSSTLYSAPLTIDRSCVIRARIFSPGSLPGSIITNSYFIDEDTKLPVFTITTDSLNLWDNQSGIYVLGPNASSTYPYRGANFWEDWRKPASIEFYDKGRNKVMSFDAEISVYGNYSRAKPQKSFEINLSDQFGTGEVAYNFIPDKPNLTTTDNIVLRNAGTDWNKVHFRDAFIERVMKGTHSGYIAAEPSNLFLNGEYWGVYTIHENHDHHWMEHNFGYEEEEIDYLKEDGSTMTVKAGTDDFWWDMYNYAVNANASTPEYYHHMDSVLDLENFSDYFIVETYINNDDWIGDWTNNIKMWRPRIPGGKYRYLLYDTDMGFGYGGLSVSQDRISKALDPTAFSHSSELFDHLTDNPTFRRYFINRYADLINTIYSPANLDDVMRSLRDSMALDMPEHWRQWGGSLSTWNGYVSDMQDFYYDRPAIVRDQIEADFQLTDQEQVTLQVIPPQAGRILISTVIPESYPWTGVYFQGNPVTLTAIPNPGYSFSHWNSTDIGASDTNGTTTVDFTTDQTVNAYFTGSSISPDIVVSEINYNSSPAFNAGDWIELKNNSQVSIDLTGWSLADEADYHAYVFPSGTVIPAGSYLVVAEDTASFHAVYPSVDNLRGPIGFGFSNGSDQVRLFDHRDSLISSFYYSDQAPWPVEADGSGYTCERLFPAADPNLGTSWFAGCLGGSPGGIYSGGAGLPIEVSGSSTFCSGTAAVLSATFLTGYSYQWLLDSVVITGENAPTIQAAQSGDYSVIASFQGCSSGSLNFTVTEVQAGPEPTVSSAYRCDPGTLTLVAQSTDTIYWFDTIGGSLIASGDTLITPYLTGSTTYYAQTSLGCPSNVVPVVATINQPPAAPIAIDRVLCGPNPINLTVQDTSPNTRWYNAPVAGALVAFGDTLDLAYLGNDTTFYIESGDLCISERTVLNVQVVESSVPTCEGVVRCGPGPVTLEAVSPDPVRWLSTSTGGLLSTANTFTTTVSSSTIYYLQSVGTCSSNPIAVPVTILPVPSSPLIDDTLLCAAAAIQLEAVSAEQVYWYDDPNSTQPVYTGPLFTTPVIDTTTTYYIETGYVCRSQPRVSVTVEFSPAPSISLGNDTAISQGDTLQLQAPGGFDYYMWSNGQTGQQISITQPGTYVVTGIMNNGCSETDVIDVAILTGIATISGTEVLGAYPNPVHGVLTASFYSTSSREITIALMDMTGRQLITFVHEAVAGINKVELDLSTLPPGAYLLGLNRTGAVKRILVH